MPTNKMKRIKVKGWAILGDYDYGRILFASETRADVRAEKARLSGYYSDCKIIRCEITFLPQ